MLSSFPKTHTRTHTRDHHHTTRPHRNKVRWWKCEEGDDHEWASPPHKFVTRDAHCPFCAKTYGKHCVCVRLCSSVLRALEEPIRVWCVQSSRSIFCVYRRASSEHNLLLTRPDLASAWHPTKNGDLRPDHLLPSSCVPVFHSMLIACRQNRIMLPTWK